ncbi:MAG: tRNA lysidine(34) synthetase TilS [Pseudomonadota bacterium]
MSAADRQPVSLVEARRLFAPFVEQPVVAIAVSGGPDSTALLWLAARWRAARKIGPDLLAVTVDHGLRKESQREAKDVKRLARHLGVPHRVVRWTGTKPTTGIQEAARNARYALLASAAKKAGAHIVLTAHTLDDQAETVLLRLLRGSGPAGLQAMADRSPYPGESGLVLARPLLSVPKARLVATLRKAGIPFAEDVSNRDPRFTRPRLRAIMPALASEGLTAQRLGLLARRLQRADAALRDAVTAAAGQVVLASGSMPSGQDNAGEAGRTALHRERFLGLPDEIALRLLGEAIGRAGYEGPVELGKLESLFEALKQTPGGSAFRRTLAGAMVTGRPAEIVIERAPPRRMRPGTPAKSRIPALTTRKTAALGPVRTR